MGRSEDQCPGPFDSPPSNPIQYLYVTIGGFLAFGVPHSRSQEEQSHRLMDDTILRFKV